MCVVQLIYVCASYLHVMTHVFRASLRGRILCLNIYLCIYSILFYDLCFLPCQYVQFVCFVHQCNCLRRVCRISVIAHSFI